MYRYHVIGNQNLTSSTLLLTLKRNQNTKPLLFQPGQYTAISFKRKGRPTPARCFSIVNSPTDKDIIQCSIRKKGRFTRALTELRPGDEVKVAGTFGGFIFDPEYDTDMVLIAGGIGIAPFMSMIQYATNMKLSNKITLIYGVRNQNDVPFSEQLKELEKRNPRFKYMINVGRIDSKIIDSAAKSLYKGKSYFICGPPQFMKAMTETLLQKGVDEDDIMTETFSQGLGVKAGDGPNLPSSVYKIGAIGMVLASFTVMVGDLIANMPVFSASQPTTQTDSANSSNSRQDDLDGLINGSSEDNSNTGTTTTKNTTTTSSNSTKATTSTPKCTTTQSGVTTCV